MLAEVDPDGLARAYGNPVAMLAAAAPARLEQLAADDGFRARLARAAARLDEHLGGDALVPDAAGRARRDRLLLARVRPQRGAAAVLGRARHPGRRPPQGRQRPRRADRRRRPLLPQRLLPPAADGARRAGGGVRRPRPGAAAARARARRRRHARADRRSPLPGATLHAAHLARRRRPRAAAAARHGRAGERPGRARASPIASTAATASTACARRSCSASAASRRSRRAASSPTCST